MRILLIHPQDSPRFGPWSRRPWDLVVDLGRSSEFSRQCWRQHYGCELITADAFRKDVLDAKQVRDIFLTGRGFLVDEEGIDQWELASVAILEQALTVLALSRLATEIPKSAELWSTRLDWPAGVLPYLLNRPLQSFQPNGIARIGAIAGHYANIVRRFSGGDIRQIFWDKYDPSFRWRSRLAREKKPMASPVILLPSAYGNVSRMAARYADLLPEESFLLVATRRSAGEFSARSNIQLRDLASYAVREAASLETASLLDRWAELSARLQSNDVLRVLSHVGVFSQVSDWLRYGVAVRDAWREVLDREPVHGVLCGDDSNLYTRLPVLLAAARKIPTVDFHHGALDGIYLVKDLPCSVYLAKTEMEQDYLERVCALPSQKIELAPPATQIPRENSINREASALVLFSEPYEVGGMRADEVYRELLPPLWRVAQDSGRKFVIKLHPFESAPQRRRIIEQVLPPAAAKRLRIVAGPMTAELLSQAWFGITIESTSALECVQQGICCFLCGWLAMAPYGYLRQYVHFGLGEVLESSAQIEQTPQRAAEFYRSSRAWRLPNSVDPAQLRKWLATPIDEPSPARFAS